jgi:hypothetical protein
LEECVNQHLSYTAVALLALATTGAAAPAQKTDSVESIYVMRSIRESRVPATEFCRESRTGFAKANFEDNYVFRSIAIRSSDSLIIDAAGAEVAAGHACLGQTDDPAVMMFYMEGVIGSIPYQGRGDCRTGRQDYPEPGVTPWRCFLDLHDIPGYVGGQLTSNTVVTRAIVGEKSDPPGYTQPSIAVIRLWRSGQGKVPRPAWEKPRP